MNSFKTLIPVTTPTLRLPASPVRIVCADLDDTYAKPNRPRSFLLWAISEAASSVVSLGDESELDGGLCAVPEPGVFRSNPSQIFAVHSLDCQYETAVDQMLCK